VGAPSRFGPDSRSFGTPTMPAVRAVQDPRHLRGGEVSTPRASSAGPSRDPHSLRPSTPEVRPGRGRSVGRSVQEPEGRRGRGAIRINHQTPPADGEGNTIGGVAAPRGEGHPLSSLLPSATLDRDARLPGTSGVLMSTCVSCMSPKVWKPGKVFGTCRVCRLAMYCSPRSVPLKELPSWAASRGSSGGDIPLYPSPFPSGDIGRPRYPEGACMSSGGVGRGRCAPHTSPGWVARCPVAPSAGQKTQAGGGVEGRAWSTATPTTVLSSPLPDPSPITGGEGGGLSALEPVDRPTAVTLDSGACWLVPPDHYLLHPPRNDQDALSFADLRWDSIRCHPSDPSLVVVCRLQQPIVLLPVRTARWWRSLLLASWERSPIHLRVSENEVAASLVREVVTTPPSAWPTPSATPFRGQDHAFMAWTSPMLAGSFAPARLPPLPGPTPLWHGSTSCFSPSPFPGHLSESAHQEVFSDHPLGDWMVHSVRCGFSLMSDTPTSPRSARNAIRGCPTSAGIAADAAMWALVATEVEDGAFARWPPGCSTTPSALRFLSFFGVPKPDGATRGVSDQSGGAGSVNACTHRSPYVGLRLARFHRIIQRIQWMKQSRPGVAVLLAKLDASRAFRQCTLPVADYHHSAYRFGNEVYVDTRLMMGASASGDAMSACISAVRDVLGREGIFSETYVDDMMLVLYEDEAPAAMDRVRSLWDQLGWRVNPKKLALEGSPATTAIFLGLLIDTVACTVAVHEDRRSKLLASISFLLSATSRPRPRDFSSLAGKLTFVSMVVPLGKVFTRSINGMGDPGGDSWRSRVDGNLVLPQGVRDDLEWWRWALSEFNGVASFRQAGGLPAGPVVHVFTDASGVGWGAHNASSGQFIAGPWSRDERHGSSTALWEAMAILFAVVSWAASAAGGYIVIHSDSMACVRSFNRLYAYHPRMYLILRALACVQIISRVRVVYVHVPGILNGTADALSRGSIPPSLRLSDRTFFPPALRRSGTCMLLASPSVPSLGGKATGPHSTTGMHTARAWVTPSLATLPWTPWNQTTWT